MPYFVPIIWPPYAPNRLVNVPRVLSFLPTGMSGILRVVLGWDTHRTKGLWTHIHTHTETHEHIPVLHFNKPNCAVCCDLEPTGTAYSKFTLVCQMCRWRHFIYLCVLVMVNYERSTHAQLKVFWPNVEHHNVKLSSTHTRPWKSWTYFVQFITA